MAFSLLDHLQTTKASELKEISADKAIQRQLIAVALGQLIVRDRQDSATVYHAIQQQKEIMLWQDVDQQTITQIAALYDMPAELFRNYTEQLYNYAASEIKILDDTANFKQAGVSELIQGQMNYLPNQAPNQVWQLLGLTELQDKNISTQQPIDLSTSIASLSKMMHEASQASHTHPDDHLELDQHSTSAIELPYQRPAPHLFLILEPLLALIILIALWFIYINLAM